MTKPSGTPSIDLLIAQLGEAKEQVEEAEVALGAATLGRKKLTAAEQRFEKATSEVRRLDAAIRLAEQRTAEAQQAAESEAAELALGESYDFVVTYAPMVARLLKDREAIKGLEEEIRERFRCAPRRLRTLLQHGSEKVEVEGVWVRRLLDETEFDADAIRGVPVVFGTASPLEFGESMTADRCAEVAERAAQLAEASREGRHADVAVTGAQRLAERRERKRERADARLAKIDNERAEGVKAKADRERAEVEKGDGRQESPAPDSRELELAGEAAARGEALADSGVAK